MPSPAREAFQVGWICALPVEVAAAKEMLDVNFGVLEEQDSTDTNSYTLGQIGKHNVVIAGLPQYGTTSATTVAINMTRTFSRSLRIGLMVGIGAGIPSANHDIRLGDIVVSYPEGTCGGVLQYDIGKVVEDGTLQRTGSLNSPPRSLLTAVVNMRAAALTDDPSHPEYIEKAIRRNARTRKTFGRPDASTDRLFHVEHEHPATAATCAACPSEWEEMRNAREEPDPQIHYGIIASGNKVMKHGATRERLRQEIGVLCFEMEAAGLMMDFPCIAIRGVCDYADSHKNEQWHGYAALAAASYAKELLGYVPVAHVSQEKLVTDVCSEIVDEVKEVNKGMQRAFHQREDHHREKMVRALTKEQQECHQAFKTSPYEQYKNINPGRADGTCRWILENSQYLDWWSSSHNDLLWISADPGCGKSVLAKSLIDVDLNTSSSVSVCYFFFKDNEEQNNLATALCAVLHQLFGMQPYLLRHALPSWQRNGTKIQQEVDELWRILVAAMSDSAFLNTVCIFDALDECRPSDRAQLIEKLERFYTQTNSSTRQSWLKFLVTSRPYDEIQEGFRPATQLFPHIHVRGEEENERIHEEISLVVKMRVAELGESLHLTPETQQRLEQQLLRMEHRTYLWLYLAIDDIRTMFRNSLQPEEESIQLVPGSVTAAYEKILNRVPSDKFSDVKMILKIIVGARRPLTIKEMAMALGVAKSPSSRTAAKAMLNPKGLDKKIRQLCGLFVFVNNTRVYLIHQTAREFLINSAMRNDSREWVFQQVDTEELMSEICINYLLLDDMDGNPLQNGVNSAAFLEYSAEYWPDHVRGMPPLAGSKVEAGLNQLYDVTSARFALWYPLFWTAVMSYSGRPKMNAIRLAAFNGHKNVFRRLIIRNESTIHQPDENGTRALHWASERGHLEIVQILLDRGADVNAQGGNHGNALQAASKKGHLEIVQLLLENEANVNAQSEEFGMTEQNGGLQSAGNALQAASEEGHLEIVLVLLDNGAEVNAQGGEYGNALQAASQGGHLGTVRLLLDKGADVNAEGGEHGNALQASSHAGHLEIVQLLLDKGACINTQGGDYGNALQVASQGGHLEIVQLLLDNGAEVNAQDEECRSSLQAASEGGHLEIVKLLLDNGADINAQGRRYSTAIYAASEGGHVEVVQLLLDNKADVNAQHGYYGSALQAASKEGHLEIVQLLLDNGADVNARDGEYRSSLLAASEKGHLEIVQLLLDNGADVNAQAVSYCNSEEGLLKIARLLADKDGEYRSSLLAASDQGHLEIVQLLLDNGADVNTQDVSYGSSLQAASEEGHFKIVQLLLDKGAGVNVQGGEYGSALQAASCGGHAEIVQLLLGNGAEVNAHYGSSLVKASYQGHLEIVQLLLDKGADVNVQGRAYGSALRAASEGEHLEIVQLLLDRGADVNVQGGDHGNALQATSQRGHLDIVEVLLDNGADVNAQDVSCGSSSRAASIEKHIEIAQLLLDNGADINAQDGEYGNALQAASQRGHFDIVQLLLDMGADVNARVEYGDALQAASDGGHLEIVQLLLDNGAEVNARGGVYGDALQAASEGGHLEIVQLLLDNGANIEAADDDGATPLWGAAWKGHKNVVQLLLDKGANIEAADNDGETPLCRAAWNDHEAVVQLLLDKGANVEAADNDGATPLWGAAWKGHKNVVHLLLEKGVDVETSDKCGSTALQVAVYRCHEAVERILISAGASDVDCFGMQALFS